MNSAAPNPRTRTCSNCNRKADFRDDWTCSRCNQKSCYHSEIYTCPTCGDRKTDFWNLNKLQIKGRCLCDLSPEKRKEALQIREDRKRILVETTERKEPEREETAIDAAKDCFASKKHFCTIPREQLPHKFCNVCTRFKPQPFRRPKNAQAPEFDEIDFENEETA